MRYGSLCSGIEAATVAFGPLGFEAAWFSEIDAFPNAVLRHHYPNVVNHGDMTTIRERIISGEIEAPDMICGGPPCQAFSVAGLRKSLDDERGNLTLEYVKICDATDTVRLAAGRPPAWILYENVPGILNTKDNAFGALLGGLCGSDTPIVAPAGWGRSGVVNGPSRTVAYRVLNAEFFGLAQRRKRVFVLARGGAGRWAVADALLPIIEGGEWHPAPSRSKGEGVAATITSGAANGGPAHGARSGSAKEGNLIPEVTRPLTAAMGTKWNGNGDLESSLIPSIVGTLTANMVGCAGTPGYNETEHILPLLVRMREGKEGGGKGPLVSEDQSLTLATGNDQVLAYRWQNDADGIVPDEVASTLRANGTTTDERTTGAYVQQASMQVRRLTPVECERLQGFPDGYTNIPWRGKPESPDGPRYKALGNSWAVPCARWIGERIKGIRS